MRHRADDLQGVVTVPALGVYAGWSAHAGSFAARQSEIARVGAPQLLWAGECFGSTSQLAANQSLSLLEQYEADPDTFVACLNGLFAGLLIDARRQAVLLFNDRYGCERLYVHERNGATYFASEAKALLSLLPDLRAFDEAGVADFLTFGSVLGGRTLFRGLQVLPSGSLWLFAPDAKPARTRYFEPRDWEAAEPLDDEGFEASLVDAFREVLPRYAVANGQLGVALTGGLDTRMILACLPPQATTAITYTYAASYGDTLDVRIARRVAAMCGLTHQTVRIPSSFVSDFGRHVDQTVYATDGCAGPLAAHEIVLSERARALAPVRLTGNFGSEVLRSVSTFKPAGLDPELVDRSWETALAEATERATQRRVHPVTHAAFEEIPWHLYGMLQAGRSQLTVRTPFLDNRIVALAYRAPSNLRRSPHPSLRVVHENRPDLASIATDRGLSWQPAWSSLPRRLFCNVTFKLDYWHTEGLPSALCTADPLLNAMAWSGLLGLHKFLPYRGWFRRELAPYLTEVVNDPFTRNMPFWNPRFLGMAVRDHTSGRRNYLRELSAILTLEAVDRIFIRGIVPAGRTAPAVCETT